jgi:hypothetical protein
VVGVAYEAHRVVPKASLVLSMSQKWSEIFLSRLARRRECRQMTTTERMKRIRTLATLVVAAVAAMALNAWCEL